MAFMYVSQTHGGYVCWLIMSIGNQVQNKFPPSPPVGSSGCITRITLNGAAPLVTALVSAVLRSCLTLHFPPWLFSFLTLLTHAR